MIVDNNDEDPATYEEAMMSPDSNKWQDAMKSEMGSMYDNKVWTLVDLPDSRKAVENKWIFKRKTDADAIAAFFDYEIWQMDVKTAFLNGDIEEELYMVQPKGFVDPKNADKLEAELQKRFEHHDPCEMMRELKLIFETHAAVESYEASKQFFNCMMEEGSSVSEHMFAMSGHAKKLSDLGIVIPNKLGEPSVDGQQDHRFKKQGKPNKGNFKKGGKKVARPEKPKAGPKPETVCYYAGEGALEAELPQILGRSRAAMPRRKVLEGSGRFHHGATTREATVGGDAPWPNGPGALGPKAQPANP
ncbi:hypothetical protein QYE76_020845 [Lolium multiflorum]|uniref:Reverse transcriptase Ty1/copia-type domain-containing protein n=1 Tax=Lolium multiflorum TaxID=4521 RepID=A0AAD8R9N5_LOLMU|nr:hypothetical protein QYE76_020845 [Lolium multiflorum]